MEGQELKMRRNKIGLIQRHLAILLGVTENTVWKWENEMARIPERIEPSLAIIESRLNKRKVRGV
jgi:DNA-binding XRE family transcriptional regulator